jgi:hypothetical protein
VEVKLKLFSYVAWCYVPEDGHLQEKTYCTGMPIAELGVSGMMQEKSDAKIELVETGLG